MTKRDADNSDTHYLLVVEDDKGLQSQLRWAFENHEVILAGDRSEAIAALRRYEPGVVLLDLGLPRILVASLRAWQL